LKILYFLVIVTQSYATPGKPILLNWQGKLLATVSEKARWHEGNIGRFRP